MNWKKAILLMLSLGIIINPVLVTAQVGSIDDPAVEEFAKDVSESWRKAETIWGQMYNIIRPLWDRHIGGIIAPLWSDIKKWFDAQITILKGAFREETEKAGEVVKKEAEQAKESVSKSIWQMILEAIGG